MNRHGGRIWADASNDPRGAGLPEGGPPVGPFLGIVLGQEDRALGYLFLARRAGREPFTEQDQRAIELLAASAAAAMQDAAMAQTLRDEAAAREDLLAVVSHDLRNPLSAAGMAARLMAASLPPDDPARRHVDIVLRSAARMDRLIDDLLTVARLREGTVARLREGRLPVEPKAQPLAPLVADAVDGVAAAAAQKHLRLSREVPKDLPGVLCDRDRILQVLSNLLGNAVKFTPDGGSVIVRASPEDGAVRVSVRDTDPGIAPDAVGHVFDRFWQEGAQARRGTGLGLFIAKGIVEAHHGVISVESRPGEGSDFRFTLPVAR